MAPKLKKSPSKGYVGGVGAFIMDFYRDPLKWQIIKHTGIFIIAVIGTREFSDIDLMAPPPPPGP